MRKVVGGFIPPKEHKKLMVEDAVDMVLDKMIFSKPDAWSKESGIRRDSMFSPLQMGALWMRATDDDKDLLFAPPESVNHPELVWPLNIGMIWPIVEDGVPHLQANRWASVPAKLLRGKYQLSGRYNIGNYICRIEQNLDYSSFVEYATWFQNKWKTSNRLMFNEAFLDSVKDAGTAPIKRFVDDGEDNFGERAAMGASIALTYRYEWGAQFSIDGAAKVIIPATPAGIRELFNDRNKPEDRDRRSALRHWVRQHRRAHKLETFSSVREHLRGEVAFQWRGFDVLIRPSQFDIDRTQP
jgi:hypothetical protein